MAKINGDVYKVLKVSIDHEQKLRDEYLKATPRQRLEIALQRMRFPDCGPNRLVQVVSAVEGLARSLVVNARVTKGETAEAAYDNVRGANATTLVRDVLALNKRPEAPVAFGTEVWEMFELAVKYRNLLIHECTFIRQSCSDPLISAASSVFGYLAAIAGPYDATDGELSV